MIDINIDKYTEPCIALILPNWVGDAVMATPVLEALRQTYPNVRIIAIGRDCILNDLYDGAPWFDYKFVWTKKIFGDNNILLLAKEVKKYKPTVTLLFTNSLRSSLLAALIGSKIIVGSYSIHRSLLYHYKQFYWIKYKKTNIYPLMEFYNSLANIVGLNNISYNMKLYIPNEFIRTVQTIWSEYSLDDYSYVVVFQPSAAYGPSKKWPIEYFAELARLIVSYLDAAVLVLFGPSDVYIARSIVKNSRSNRVYVLDNVLPSLNLTKALLTRASILVSNDSGPRHIAAAVGCRVMTIFGPTYQEKTNIYYPYEVCFQRKVECGPCEYRVCPYGHHICMVSLYPYQLYDKIYNILRMC
jgi:heptosyltransferase-2